MNYQKFRGSGVALITPFNNEGAIDFIGLGRLIDYCISGGIQYLVSLGTTGESVNLSKEEKRSVLEFTVSHVGGRVPIVAGIGGNNTALLIQEMNDFHFNGIDAILSVSPYYNKPTQRGIIEHYKALAKEAPLPIILYNVPGRTGSNINAETTITLSEVDNIIGIKEASGHFGQCMQIVKHTRSEFLKISGDDNLTLPLLSLGFDGVISVSGQGFPTPFSQMVQFALNGDFEKAKRLHYLLLEVTDLLFVEGNPGGIKEVLQFAGICETYIRLPLVSVSEDLRQRIKVEFDKIMKNA